MIEWVNVDLIPFALESEGNPYLLLDRSKKGPLFRLRLGYPNQEEHPTIRIKRVSLKRFKTSADYEKLKAATDLNTIVAILGLTPISNIKKVKDALPPSLRPQTYAQFSFVPPGVNISGGWAYATTGNNLHWQVDLETTSFNLGDEPENPGYQG